MFGACRPKRPPLAVRIILKTYSSDCRQGLENRIMFAVDRKERCAARLGRLSHQLPAVTKRFLVGQRHGLPALTGGHRWSKPAQPTIAAMTKSASPAAASTRASPPVAARQRCLEEPLRDRGSRLRRRSLRFPHWSDGPRQRAAAIFTAVSSETTSNHRAIAL